MVWWIIHKTGCGAVTIFSLGFTLSWPHPNGFLDKFWIQFALSDIKGRSFQLVKTKDAPIRIFGPISDSDHGNRYCPIPIPISQKIVCYMFSFSNADYNSNL